VFLAVDYSCFVRVLTQSLREFIALTGGPKYLSEED